MNMYWHKDIETMDRASLRSLQQERLRWTGEHAYQNVPYYRRMLDGAGVTPDQIRSLDDIRRLPFTVKDDLRKNYPFGMYAVPMSKVVRVHASSGTTGKPTVVGYTRGDLDRWTDKIGRAHV
jgi:phenylacetate-CoA ligase